MHSPSQQTTPSQEIIAPSKTRWKRNCALFVLFLALVVGLQWTQGAYDAEFGSEPDEAGHYITGLFVHDYVAAGFPRHAAEFAYNYYNHYPKVALGHWPPGFYLAQTVWSLVFSPQRASMLVFMAALTAAVALILFRLIEKQFSALAGVFGVLLFLSFPLVQKFSAAIMTEIPMTLLTLIATVFFARYMERGRPRDVILFGVVAGCAILTKLSGVMLAFVPPIAIVLTGRFDLLKKRAFWLSAVVVAIIAGPWTAATLKIASNGMAEEPFGWAFTSKAVPYYFGKLFLATGAAVLIAAVIGIVQKLTRPRDPVQPGHFIWPSIFGLLIGVLLVTTLIPAGREERHLTPALPAVVMFTVAGAAAVIRWLTAKKLTTTIAGAIVVTVIAAGFIIQTFRIGHKGFRGFRPAAEWLVQQAKLDQKFLVCSDARGEGMFISEVAMADKLMWQRHFAERASKKLADSDWNGGGYKLLYANWMSDKKDKKKEYNSESDLLRLLQEDTVDYIILDSSLVSDTVPKHQTLLRDTIVHHPQNFTLEKQLPLERGGKVYPDAITVYHLKRS